MDKLLVHHIGGIGECGPTEALSILKEHVDWTLYDAEENLLNQTELKGKSGQLINRCIGNKDGTTKFYLTKSASASSMIKPNKQAKEWVLPGNRPIKWGEHTEIVKEIEMQVSKLDTLIKEGSVPKIDFLSIDAQGADFDIIKGAEENINDILGIVCEIEFSRLYENQPLFYEVFEYLDKKGFRLAEIYNQQYVNQYPFPRTIQGKGFLTIGEALFLRNPENMLKNAQDNYEKLMKLAIIGVCFNQTDFALGILRELDKNGLLKDEGGFTHALTKLTKVAQTLWNI